MNPYDFFEKWEKVNCALEKTANFAMKLLVVAIVAKVIYLVLQYFFL